MRAPSDESGFATRVTGGGIKTVVTDQFTCPTVARFAYADAHRLGPSDAYSKSPLVIVGNAGWQGIVKAQTAELPFDLPDCAAKLQQFIF